MSKKKVALEAAKVVMMQVDQPLYDTEWLRPGFLFKQQLICFQRPIGQMNSLGEAKTYADTNMTNASQLGVPQSFEISGIGIEVLGDASEDDKKRALEQGVFVLNMGQGRPWARMPLSVAAEVGVQLPSELKTIKCGETFNVELNWPLAPTPSSPDNQKGDDERSLEFAIKSKIGIRVVMFGRLSVPK